MYAVLLTLHSLNRWLVLMALVYSLFRAYRGWFGKKPFSPADDSARFWAVNMAHIQFILGILLYVISPITKYFIHYFNDAVHQREIRFFGMEHSTMMIIAIVVLTIGASKAKRRPTDYAKFKTMAVWFTIALLIILSSIPWSFSPAVIRPTFRWF